MWAATRVNVEQASTLKTSGGPSRRRFFVRTCTSYSVSGLRSTKVKLVTGVSKPKLQSLSDAPASLIRTT